MIRSKRKINKLRGSRSNGGGCTKKRRGAGNKGVEVMQELPNNIGLGLQNLTQTIMVNMDSKDLKK